MKDRSPISLPPEVLKEFVGHRIRIHNLAESAKDAALGFGGIKTAAYFIDTKKEAEAEIGKFCSEHGIPNTTSSLSKYHS